MFIHFYLVDIRHLQNHIIVYFFALFWRPLWPSALGSQNAAPALIRGCYSK